MENKVVVAFAIYLQLYTHLRNKRKTLNKRKRRWYARPLNSDRLNGYYHKYFKKMRDIDTEQFQKHTRMSKDLYLMLLTIIERSITKRKQRINADERLSITLLFLSQAVSIQSIAWSYRLGKSTVRLIILETCEAIWSSLAPIYLSEPTKNQYVDIAKDFEEQWNFPNCVGAIDGKHVAVKCPKKSGTMYFNYKKYYSIVLMAVCDAKYTFTAVSVGSYGSESDGGVFNLSPFGRALVNNKLPLPEDKQLPNSTQVAPHVFVADAAFGLGPHIMKPIAPGRSGQNLDLKSKVFNYRLSRARRTIENAFGILTARWRILRTTLEFMPENCEIVVLACIALHNFVMLHDGARYCSPTYVDRYMPDQSIIPGEWRVDLERHGGPLRSITSHARHSAAYALELRQKFAHYFINEGAVEFQYQAIK